jgi:hypothetical protein
VEFGGSPGIVITLPQGKCPAERFGGMFGGAWGVSSLAGCSTENCL